MSAHRCTHAPPLPTPPPPLHTPTGNLYALANSSLVNAGTAGNARLCGMVPLGVRQAHYFNFYGTGGWAWVGKRAVATESAAV